MGALLDPGPLACPSHLQSLNLVQHILSLHGSDPALQRQLVPRVRAHPDLFQFPQERG